MGALEILWQFHYIIMIAFLGNKSFKKVVWIFQGIIILRIALE